MSGVGVVINASARRAQRDPEMVQRIRDRLPAGHAFVTSSVDEIGPALRSLRAKNIDTLGIVGGDGTVGGTLTPFLDVWPDARPDVILLAGGTVCTIPKSLGATGGPERNLYRLLDGATPVVSRRPLVEVETAEGARHFGMIYANGAAVRWLEAYYAQPNPGPLAAAAVVSRAVASAALGGAFARRLFARIRAKVHVDGELLDDAAFTALGVSGVEHIGLGFRPFHFAGQHPDRVHVLATTASAPRIGAELPALRAGFTARSPILDHFAARECRIDSESPEPWSLDADLYPATTSLRVSAGPAVRFLAV